MFIRNSYASIFALTLLGALSGTAAAYDCDHASSDIGRLQAEKHNTAERVLKGATAILPIGAVVHVLEGNERQALKEIGTDEYDKHLDARIAAIESACAG